MTRYFITPMLLLLLLRACPLLGQGSPAATPETPPVTPYCGFDAIQADLGRRDPAVAARTRAIDQTVYRLLDRSSGKLAPERSPSGAARYSIPIVVHIIHNGGPENLSDADVRTAIGNLNDAFENVGVYDSTTGVSVGITFCLARQDPRGKATTGITRVQSPLTDMILETNDLAVKSLDRWDPTRYLNIWVVHTISSRSSGDGVSGFAYYPSSHGTLHDGVLLEADLMSRGVHPIKILVHEIGHYLGLYHTFQGGCVNNNCLLDGDYICDTPPDGSSADIPCGDRNNTCTSDADDRSANNPFRPVSLGGLGDRDDMIENYMDYGSQACKSAFTAGQRDRMIAILTTVRGSLLDSKGCDDPCDADILPSFSQGDAVIAAGTTLAFDNLTTGGATSFAWLLDGKPYATTRTTSVTFREKGTFKVTLVASTADSTCTREHSATITVRCPMSLSFTADATSILPGGTVLFRNTSSGAESYDWYIDGVHIGSGSDSSTHTFNAAGGYQAYMVGRVGDCYDTVGPILIRVGDCKVDKEESLWYFGDGTGLDFRIGAPIVVTNGPMKTHEGSATICDRGGRLLFYSDGSTVWGRDNKVMENGYGIIGSQWAVQGTTIVRAPVSDSLFYLFTVLNWGDDETGLRYSVIDMARNKGLGAVTEAKNVLINKEVSERLAAVYHENCLDVWIVTHEERSTKFLAYLLTPDGIAPNPVVSQIGALGTGENRYGCLKFSPNGKRLVSVLGGTAARTTVEVFDFDPGTGVVSNGIKLTNPGDMIGAYSAEFSPNNNLLYVTAINGDFVYQYDLTLPSASDIITAKKDVASTLDTRIGLQLGPDGKIYVTRNESPFLDVIDLPNNKGKSCGYKVMGVDLAGRNGPMSLPGYVAGYAVRELAIKGDSGGCVRHQGTFSASGGWCSRGTYLWKVKGPATIRSINGADLTLDFIDSGVVTLYLDNDNPCGSISDTVEVAVAFMPVLELGNDTAVCSSGMMLDAGPGFSAYRWSNGSDSRMIRAGATGAYWVEVTGPGGCVERDTINIAVALASVALDIGSDTAVCNGEIVTLDAGPGFKSYRWQDGSDLQTFSAYLPGRYWVTAESACGDMITDTIEIATRTDGKVDLGSDFASCFIEPITLDAGTLGSIYLWSTGERSRTIQVRSAGTYAVYVSNGHCEWRDTVEITYGVDHAYVVWLPDLGSAAALPLDTDIVVPLRIQTVSGAGLAPGTPFSGTISFNGTTLLPWEETTGPSAPARRRSIRVSGKTGRSDTLALFKFTTLLGDSEMTSLTIDSIAVGDPCLLDLAARPGSVTLAICRADGTPRLIDVSAEPFAMTVPRPNPAGDRAEVRYSLVERGITRLHLLDPLGRSVLVVRDGPADPGIYSAAIDTRDLPSGLYFVALESPTGRVVRRLMVAR